MEPAVTRQEGVGACAETLPGNRKPERLGVCAGFGLALILWNSPAFAQSVLRIVDATVPERAGVAEFTVTLGPASTSAVTVGYRTADDSGDTAATAGEDYATIRSGLLTFAAGETTKVIRVTVHQDQLDESDETFSLILKDPVGAALGEAGATGTITDDDDPPQLSMADPQAVSEGEAENARYSEFQILLSVPSGQPVRFSYATGDTGTSAGSQAATVGEDYTEFRGRAEIAPGETSLILRVPILDDDIDEYREMLSLSVAAVDNATLKDDAVTLTAFGEIVDDEATPNPSASCGNSSGKDGVAESDGEATVTITLSGLTSKSVKALYRTADPSDAALSAAEAGTDYEGVGGSGRMLEFDEAHENPEMSFAIPLFDDRVDEPDESFEVRFSSFMVGTDTFTLDAATCTILDDDGLPNLGVSDRHVLESATEVEFTVELDAPSASEVTVAYATEDGAGSSGASDPDDYTGASGSFTFMPGDTAKTLTVGIVADTRDEDDETFTVRLSDPTHAALDQAEAIGTIVDDDGAPSLAISNAVAKEYEGHIDFTVTLLPADPGRVTVKYATSSPIAHAEDGVPSGVAEPNVDYTETSGSLTFAPGETQKTIRVSLRTDDQVEKREVFTVTLSEPVGASLGNQPTARGTILSTDPLEFTIEDAQGDEDDGTDGGEIAFTLRLSSEHGERVSVWYETVGKGSSGNTNYACTSVNTQEISAEASDDFNQANGRVFFDAGETSQTVTVSIDEDTKDEADETFAVVLSSPTGGHVVLGHRCSAIGTIRDNDDPPVLSIEDASGTEVGDDSVDFTLSLDATSGRKVEVKYRIADDTATKNVDYKPTASRSAMYDGIVVFEEDRQTATLSVPILDDSHDEEDEIFTVALLAPAHATLDSTKSSATGTIQDNDDPPVLSTEDPVALESTGSVTFTVQLSATSYQNVSVEYATTDGTATAGQDFTAPASPNNTLTIAAGETQGTITIALVDDSDDEEDETFEITLNNPTHASLGLDSDATATIIDNDGNPKLNIINSQGAESDGVIRFPVMMSPASTQTVTVEYNSSDNTATAGADYVAAAGAILTFAPGETKKTINLSLLQDTEAENDETFTVVLSNASRAALGSMTSATGTIKDAKPLQMGIGNAAAYEGEIMQFPVSLSGRRAQSVTVEYATTDGSAKDGTDYTGIRGTQVIPAGMTRVLLDVPILKDGIAEEQETFTLALSNPSGASLNARTTATGTIEVAGLTITDATADETDSSMSFVVSLSETRAQGVSVEYRIEDDTTTMDADYTIDSESRRLTFGPTETTQTIQVTPVADQEIEGDETFTVTLFNPVGATLGGKFSATGTLADNNLPGLTIGDANANERDGRIDFTVELSDVSPLDVTVDYATAEIDDDAAATAEEDYRTTQGTLFILAGEERGMISVPLLEDRIEEEDEVFELKLSNPSVASLGLEETLTATGTIKDSEFWSEGRVNEELLPRITQAMVGSTLSAISERTRSGEPKRQRNRSLIEQMLALVPSAPERRAMDLKRLLGGLSFSTPLGGREPSGFQDLWLWGRSDYQNLSGGSRQGLDWDGHLFNIHVGADMKVHPRLLAGFALSWSSGDFDYHTRSGDGRYQARMTSVYPYVHWSSPKGGLTAWATVGYGRGEVEIDYDHATQLSDTHMKTFAGGLSGRLLTSRNMLHGGTTLLRFRSEASLTEVETDGGGRIYAITADMQNLRLALEASHIRHLASGAELAPSVELGVRHDSGDGLDGSGMELNAKLRYTHPKHRLTMESQGRILLTHSEDYDQWGLSGEIRMDETANRQGLSFNVMSRWGMVAPSTDRLWSRQAVEMPWQEAQSISRQLNAEVRYGFPIFGGVGLLTPYARTLLAEKGRQDYEIGHRFVIGPDFNLILMGRRSRDGTSNPYDNEFAVWSELLF